MKKEKTIKYLENVKKRGEKMVISEILKSVGWTNKIFDTYLNGLGLAYRKGFIDAFERYNKKPYEGTYKETEKIISDAVKKNKEDFYREMLKLKGGKEYVRKS